MYLEDCVVKSVLPLIKVNEKIIDEELLACELKNHPHEDIGTVIQQAGQALVIRELLMEQIIQKGMTSSQGKEKDAVKRLLAEVVTYDVPTEDDCLTYFETHPHQFMSPTLMDVDHILLSASADNLAARQKAKNKAYDIIGRLTQNPLLFAALAEQYSSCASKKAGGFLGQISKGQTALEFERELMLLSEGLAKKPIASRRGYHVVNIHRKIEGDSLNYQLMAEKVRAYLTHQASNLAIQRYIRGLVENAKIEGIRLNLDNTKSIGSY